MPARERLFAAQNAAEAAERLIMCVEDHQKARIAM
jgi:hypothetical protein